MPNIALFDDRPEVRKALAKNFKIGLPKEWECISSAPLRDVTKYPKWITDNDVQVIVIDWLLDEQVEGQNANESVNYKGYNVVQSIRKQLPEMPIFVITAQPDDDDLKEHELDIEGAFTRRDFASAPKKYVQPMIRAGKQFAKQYQHQLAELSKLAAKIAAGNATTAEKKRLKALQVTMGLIPSREIEGMRSKALDEFEQKLVEVDSLAAEIREYLNGKK